MSRTLETAYIPKDQIHADWTLNPCERDEAHITTLANHINRDGYNEDYPLIVFRIKDVELLQLTCGFHRFEATQSDNPDYPNLPLKEVYCEIREGTWQEMIRCMNEDNFKHSPAYNSAVGRAPSREALRKMRLRLMLFPDTFILSDRALGNRWRCDHKAIGSLRDTIIEQFATGEFPPVDVPEYRFLEASDMEALTAIIESDLYRGLDGKMRKRTTAAKQPTDADNEVLQVRLKDARADVESAIGMLRETWQSHECVGEFSDFLHAAATALNCDAETLLLLCGEVEQTKRTEKRVQAISLKELEHYDQHIRTMIGCLDGYTDWTVPFLRPDYLLGRWNTDYLSKLDAIFVEHGVHPNSVRAIIGREIQNDYGKATYSMTASELVALISTAKTVVGHPKEPEIAWKRNRGQDIVWALAVLSKAKPEAEQVAPETANDREASKLLKQKKQALKFMWDKRIQAATDYTGDSDTDLNQYLSLPDLEKGFAEYEAHDYCADAFRSAFHRTSETSFNIFVEKTLESDVSLEVLREEARAMDTYAYDILQWQKQNWIQQLIEKAKAKSEKSEKQERPTPDEAFKTHSPIELPKKPNRKELKRQHLSAVVNVQSAFFSADLHEHESFSHHPHVETGRKAQEFFKRIVKEKDLRLNIFSEDYYYKTGDTHEAEYPDMYRGRDLTNAEIEAEIEVLKELVENIRFYAKGDDCHIGWLDKILSTGEALIPDTTAEADTPEIDAQRAEIQLDMVRKDAEQARYDMWIAFDEAGLTDCIEHHAFVERAAELPGFEIENLQCFHDPSEIRKLANREAHRYRWLFEQITFQIENEAFWIKEIMAGHEKPDTSKMVEAPSAASKTPDRKITPDDLYGLSLDDIFTHVVYRVDNIPIEDESAVMERMATLLGEASRGWTGTQLYLLMKYAMLVSTKEDN